MILSKINRKEIIPKHITIKFLKTNDKGKFLKKIEMKDTL